MLNTLYFSMDHFWGPGQYGFGPIGPSGTGILNYPPFLKSLINKNNHNSISDLNEMIFDKCYLIYFLD